MGCLNLLQASSLKNSKSYIILDSNRDEAISKVKV